MKLKKRKELDKKYLDSVYNSIWYKQYCRTRKQTINQTKEELTEGIYEKMYHYFSDKPYFNEIMKFAENHILS